MARIVAALAAAVGLVACGGSSTSACGSACQKLAGCGLCIADRTTGQCQTTAQCTTNCEQQSGGTAQAQCVNKVSGCDQAAITLCIPSG